MWHPHLDSYTTRAELWKVEEEEETLGCYRTPVQDVIPDWLVLSMRATQGGDPPSAPLFHPQVKTSLVHFAFPFVIPPMFQTLFLIFRLFILSL